MSTNMQIMSRTKQRPNRNRSRKPGLIKNSLVKFRVNKTWKETVNEIIKSNGFLYGNNQDKNQSAFFRRLIMQGMLQNVKPEFITTIQNLLEEN